MMGRVQARMVDRAAASGCRRATLQAQGRTVEGFERGDYRLHGNGILVVEISRDGRSLAYSAPDDPTYPDAIGAEIRIRELDAARATLGAARVLVPRGSLGVELPGFSPDGRWLVYSRRQGAAHAGAAVTTADGRDGFEISTDARDEKARWASTTAPARADGALAELGWIVLLSSRPVGARPQTTAPQL